MLAKKNPTIDSHSSGSQTFLACDKYKVDRLVQKVTFYFPYERRSTTASLTDHSEDFYLCPLGIIIVSLDSAQSLQ